jgi:hypothetical protein
MGESVKRLPPGYNILSKYRYQHIPTQDDRLDRTVCRHRDRFASYRMAWSDFRYTDLFHRCALVIGSDQLARSFLRHAEFFSASIERHRPPLYFEKWTLKQVRVTVNYRAGVVR